MQLTRILTYMFKSNGLTVSTTVNVHIYIYIYLYIIHVCTMQYNIHVDKAVRL